MTNLWSNTAGGMTNVYGYDALGRLTNVVGDSTLLSSYQFDPVGNMRAMRYANGVMNLYLYDSLNRLTNVTWKAGNTSLASFAYTLGATGNRTNLVENLNGSLRTNVWVYDSLYRMTNEAVGVLGTNRYAYDVVGNRTNRTSMMGSLTNQNFTFNTNDWLTSDTYDANGNTTAASGNNYSYDALNRLTNANNSVYLGYDGDGNRVWKTVGSTRTYYVVDDRNPSGYAQVLEEWTVTATATNLAKVYNYGLTLIDQRAPGGSTYYFVYDGHGSTRVLTDNAGSVANALSYDAYGTLVASNTTAQTVYLYSGQQFDPDLGQYYLRARTYNPNTGRFWTMDTYAGDNEEPLSLHKYLYGEDNPVNGSDPSGMAYSPDEGAAMERLIGADYAEAHPVAEVSYGQQAGIGKNPLLKPDILNKTDKTFADIKPLSLAGIYKGINQLDDYEESLKNLKYTRELWPLNSFAPVRTVFYNYNPYFYFNVDGILFYTRIDPGTAILPISIPGLRKLAAEQAVKLAAGEATTFEAVVGAEAVGVATAETAGIGAVTAVATLNSFEGAP